MASLTRTNGQPVLTPISELLPDLGPGASQGPKLLLRRVDNGDLVQSGVDTNPALAPPELAPGGDLSTVGQQLWAKTPPELRR